MTPTLLSFFTFLAVVTAVAGVYSVATDLFLRDQSRLNRRIDVEFVKRQSEQARKLALFKDPGQFALVLPVRAESSRGLRRWFQEMIEQSGLPLTAGRLLARSAGAGAASGIVGGLASQKPLVGLIAALLAAVAPIFHVQRVRHARNARLLGQLPNAFELMSRVVRAGQTVSQALRAVADEFPAPLATEFASCYEQQNLGLSLEAALQDLARRTGLAEIKIFVLALLVQQQAGGNLGELLDKLSTLIRERFQIQGQIRALTAEGRAQAAVLLVLPLVMFSFILIFNRDYAAILLARPELIVGCLVSEAVGALWIRQIINFDF